jgi:hypothetical protein
VAAGDGRPVHDALVPIPAGTATIPPGATSQLWLSLHAPPTATAGASGYVRFEPVDGSAGEPVTVPLTVTLVPVSIRSVRPVHCFTWNLAAAPVSDDPAWLTAHLRDLAEHGVDVCMIHSLQMLPRVRANADGALAEPLDFSKVDRLLAASEGLFDLYYVTMDIFEKGQVRRDLFGLQFGTPSYEKAFKTWFRQVVDHLLAKGLTYERFLVNPYDESVGNECQQLSGWIKAVDPRVRTIIDCSTPDVEVARKMDALTDVWVPHHKYHFAADHKAFFEFLRSTQKPHWCYFYSEGGNDKAQNPTRHYLAKFWWAFSEGVTGVCYWAQQYYGDPWYRAGWKQAYDTSLVYPIAGGVIPSRRWQAWRRGWQDYNLLFLARESAVKAGDKAKQEQLAGYVEEVVKVPGDPQKAEAVRAWLKRLLLERPG